MTALKIIGIILLSVLGLILFILLLIIALLSFRTKLSLIWTDHEKRIDLKYLFWNFQIYPSQKKKDDLDKKEKKEKNNTEKKSPSKFSEFIKGKIKKLDLSDYIEMLSGFKDSFIKTFLFDKLHLLIVVASKEPNKTAVQYGSLSAAVFPLLGKLYNSNRLKDADVHIVPDFMGEKMRFSVDTIVSLRQIAIVSWLLKVLIKIMKK